MPPISEEKKEKISEQILHHLFSASPEPQFTAKIAQEIARDEEFTKTLLLNLKEKQLITEINRNPKGILYIKRQRWRLSNKAFEVYNKQSTQSTF